MRWAIWVVFLVGAVATSCGDSGSDPCPIGAEGCRCTEGGGCDPGLTCLSNLCVSLGSDADADADADADVDADVPFDADDGGTCDSDDCMMICRAGGYESGRCVDDACECVEYSDAGADADADADVGSECVIGGTSHATDAVNPGNECQWCRPAISATDWTARPDFTPCSIVTDPDYSYDICARGTCVSPGSCGDAACNAPGPNWTLPDTNQRSCYSREGPTDCPGTAGSTACATTIFCGQDAQYGWDTLNPASARFTRTGAAEPVVTDNVTGLVWQGCPAGQIGESCSGTESRHWWTSALAYCDGLVWGGSSDWGLPDPYELQTLVDNDQRNLPTIDRTAFPGTLQLAFWTSASAAETFINAWRVDFGSGNATPDEKRFNYPVRCVRRPAGAVSDRPRFVRTAPVAGQPVVEDTRTGRFWQGCPAGLTGDDCADGTVSTLTWYAALAYCQGLDWGGWTDWYLPNATELRAIVDDSHFEPALDTTAFPATPGGIHWSSTTVSYSAGLVSGPRTARTVSFRAGLLTSYNKADVNRYNVRCVRAGP